MTATEDQIQTDPPPDESPDEPAGPTPVRPSSARRTLLAAAAFLAPIVIAIVAVILLAGRDSGGSSTPAAPAGPGRTWEFSIPAGTAARMAIGYPVDDIMPEVLEIRAGDTVVVENLDDAVHTFGPLSVEPSSTLRYRFEAPGYYFGICTVGTHDTVTILVT